LTDAPTNLDFGSEALKVLEWRCKLQRIFFQKKTMALPTEEVRALCVVGWS
jgi:hypothetical protein